MDSGPSSSKDEVDALIEQIRQTARLQRAAPFRGNVEGATHVSLPDSSGVLDGYLDELARRSHPRTDLPVRFRRFPLTIDPVCSLALRVYNLLTREQRAGNVLVRDALQAVQATLARNEIASREIVVLTKYVGALLMQRRREHTPEDRRETHEPDELATRSRARMDAFFAALGDEFRGSPALIKDRLRVYVPLIRTASLGTPALDLGCGRGEWLELMREEDIESIGVEQNEALAAACLAKKLNVVEADFVAFLKQSPPDHWRIVTGFHVIDHLGWPEWYDCLRHIHRALRPGGMVILETPNPANMRTATSRFYLDPTHRQPIPEALLAFAARSLGFISVEVLPLHPLAEPSSETTAGTASEIDDSELVRLLSGPQDYALIARK